MSFCPALNCNNRDVKKNREKGLTFHRFPFSTPAVLELWRVNMRRVGPDGELWRPTEGMRLCSAHFTSECFDRTGQTVRLRPGAIPTIFNFKGERPLLPKILIPDTTEKGKAVPAPVESAVDHSYFSPREQPRLKRKMLYDVNCTGEAFLKRVDADKTKKKRPRKKVSCHLCCINSTVNS